VFYLHESQTCAPNPRCPSLEVRDGKATKTNIIDSTTALRVEKVAKEVIMMKKRSSTKGYPAFFGTTVIVKKGRLAAMAGGELRIRKKKSLNVNTVGGKKKRMDVYEESNKRATVEEKSFAVSKARREASVSDAMEIDSYDELPSPGLLFTL
jgi:hypothetical protein